MNKAVFYIMGGYVLCFAAALLGAGLVGFLSPIGRVPRLNPQEFVRVMALAILVTVVGLGLFKLRKWAALLCCLFTLYMAFLTCRDAIWPGKSSPGDANWVGFLWAAVFMIPSVLTAVNWRSLVWRGSQAGHSQV